MSREEPTPIAPESAARRFVLGADLGKVTTSLAWAELDERGVPGEPQTSCVRHLGEPFAPFLELYDRLREQGFAPGAVAATGLYGDRLAAPVLAGIPEETAQERAAARLFPGGALNVVRIGGSGYSVLTRDADGRFGFEANERCSAGTGETVEGLCGRLGATIDEAVAAAEGCADGIDVTSRCAVFAKSELTHYANQGEPHGRLFRGVFESVARNVHALFDKVKVDGPIVLVGNGATIAPLAAAFAELAGAEVLVPPQAGVFEALGAFGYAAQVCAGERAGGGLGGAWPANARALVARKERRIRSLAAAVDGPGSVVRLDGSAAYGGSELTGAVLGLDLGSTGSKAALLDAATGALLLDIYRRTDGNPVEAARALVAELLERTAGEHRVVALGITGSGRDAAATVARAAFPDIGARLSVQNEIVAHATAAQRLDPDHGRSLSIVEIGGQDAKFINMSGGHILESDMNRVCSAGTGSFLEEQALAMGLADIAEFGDHATLSASPPDLGTTCTVFVADVMAEALADGYGRDDLFAGLQYSVIRNYRHRVMGRRRLLERVFFQGKPATNPSLARTLAAVTGREVWVPPDPGAMGAIGIALLAAAAASGDGRAAGEVAGEADVSYEPLRLERLVDAHVSARRELRCGDSACANRCRLEKATVVVDGAERTIVSGGNCPKYDDRSAVGEKLPKDAPNPFRERAALLAGLLAEACPAPPRRPRAAATGGVGQTRPIVAIPYAHYLVDLLPFFDGFFRALGCEVRVLRSGPETLAEGDRLCAATGVCAPAKLLHGLGAAAAAGGADYFFAPKVINLIYPHSGEGTSTCPMAQGTPELVETALGPDGPVVLRPILLRRGGDDLSSAEAARELAAVARRLGRRGGFSRAYRFAKTRQAEYESGLRAIGARALAFAHERGVPTVLVVGETHVVHEALLDCGVADLASANGAVALPLDCWPDTTGIAGLARVHWASAGAILRTSLAALKADAYPLLVCAYGCGPDSLIEHLFDDLLVGYPHTVLESDGHGGKAGYVTRVQAFLHSVHSYRRAAAAAPPPPSLARYDRVLKRSLAAGDYERVYFGNIGGTLARPIAAAVRSAGVPAEYVGPADDAAFETSREVCSGKECLPYQLIWGSLAKRLAAHGDGAARGNGHPAGGNGHPAGNGAGPAPPTSLFLSVGQGFYACRAHLFPLLEELAMSAAGRDDVDIADISMVFDDLTLVPAAWAGIVATDLLNMMRFYHYVDEPLRGAADLVFAQFAGELDATLELPRGAIRALGGDRLGAAVGGARAVLDTLRRVDDVVDRAAAAFAELSLARPAASDAGAPSGERTVYVCGDVFLRVDEWGNDGVQRRLSDLGLRVLSEPFGEFFELIALHDLQCKRRLSKAAAIRLTTLRVMRRVIERQLAVARRHEPWLQWHDVRAVEAASRELFDGYPFGESVATIGSALHVWRTTPVDGVVVVSPRTCAPALISEAQLRRHGGVPLVFVYNDGDPIDEARLSGFAWRLREQPKRPPT